MPYSSSSLLAIFSSNLLDQPHYGRGHRHRVPLWIMWTLGACPRTRRRHAEIGISRTRGSASFSSLPLSEQGILNGPAHLSCPRRVDTASRSMAHPSTSSCAVPPPRLETGFLEHPFPEYIRIIEKAHRGPRGPGTDWRRVMSYAWDIFHAASARVGVWNPACEWGAAFNRAFAPPYTNIVLPACYEMLADPLGRLLRHLKELLESIRMARDDETVKQYLVCLRICITRKREMTGLFPPSYAQNLSICAKSW